MYKELHCKGKPYRYSERLVRFLGTEKQTDILLILGILEYKWKIWTNKLKWWDVFVYLFSYDKMLRP